jgi:FkbM family methyltransferase
MHYTLESDDGTEVAFECADTVISRWVCGEILGGRTYPWLPFVPDVRVVLDVGANCGAASVYFARHSPEAQIHAFEPGSEPRAVLDRNAAAYPNVSVHPFGLHAVDQTVPLYKGDNDSIKASVFRRDVNTEESEQVGLRAAGAWAAENGVDRIDVLKLDVEGCEVDVLRSLRSLIPTIKVLYVEYDSRAARREIDALVAATHELYFASMQFLDQGEMIYVRNDLVDRPGARELLLGFFSGSADRS